MKVGKEVHSFSQFTSKITSFNIPRSRPRNKFAHIARMVFMSVVLLNILFLPININPTLALVDAASSSVNTWWPTSGAHVQGVQPFKAMVEGFDVSEYDMYWQVDGGQLNHMDNNYTDYQHKETSVDVGGWSWHGSGPYVVNFVAQKGGVTVAQSSIDLYVENGLPTWQPSAAPQAVAPEPQSVQGVVTEVVNAVSEAKVATISIANAAPASDSNFYVNPNSPAKKQATEWRTSRPADAQKMDVLANTPSAAWFGGWSGDIYSAVSSYVSGAAGQGQVPVMIAYNVPQRDCGGYSAGGSSDYTNWIGTFARGIGAATAIVILEPDALAQMGCLSASDQESRYSLLSGAVSVLKSNPNTQVYIDAGHSNWIDPSVMAAQLQRANVARADGFAVNVGKHFVIDTSRNGSGSNGEWCNPGGRGIGNKPTTNTGNSLIDAYLWLKTPGESDGNCNGGPNAGVWWPDYALTLVH
jgi:endoglucanase